VKLIFSIAGMTIVAASVLGQGRVMFRHLDPAHGIDAPVYSGPPGSPLGNWRLNSGMYGRIALLGGPIGSQPANVYGNFATWTPGTLTMLGGPTTGATWVNVGYGDTAGYAMVGNDIARVVPNVGYGQPVMLQMVAWTVYDTDWQGAYQSWTSGWGVGVVPQLACSKPWIVTTTQGPGDTSYAMNNGLTSFYLTADPIPEPSILAIAGACAGLQIIWRMRASRVRV